MFRKVLRYLRKRRDWSRHARGLTGVKTLQAFREYVGQCGYDPVYIREGEKPDVAELKITQAELLLESQSLDLGGAHVLDIGPGYGHFLDVCRQRGAFTVGVDYDPFLVRWLQLRGHFGIRHNVLKNLDPLQGNLFELVHLRGSIIADYFNLVGMGRLRRFLSRIDTILAPRGRVLMCPYFELVGAQRIRRIPDPFDCEFTRVVREAGYVALPTEGELRNDEMYPVTYLKT